MTRQGGYPQELRERAVRMVFEHQGEHPSWRRRAGLEGLVHHLDRGSRYLAIRYTERLAEAGRGHLGGFPRRLLRHALAETIIGLDRTELIRRRSHWKGLEEVEYATLEWVDWFNHRRLPGADRACPAG